MLQVVEAHYFIELKIEIACCYFLPSVSLQIRFQKFSVIFKDLLLYRNSIF